MAESLYNSFYTYTTDMWTLNMHKTIKAKKRPPTDSNKQLRAEPHMLRNANTCRHIHCVSKK